ncbi:MAG: aconitase family protein, partial [Haliscomenobacter sp.]
EAMSCTRKGTICNMGAEIGATTSTFGYDDSMGRYLRSTGRAEIADLADGIREHLTGDPECYAQPEKYFDQVVEIDLSSLEPHINGPYTPDLAWPISKFAEAVKENAYPQKLEVGLIGSCTNSSYEDLDRAASVARQAKVKKLKAKAEFTITPGSEQIRYTVERDGQLAAFEEIGGVVMANACGPCIGQWARHTDDPTRANSIITSFNRNFSKRNDGNPQTRSFVASPEIVTAMVIAGDLAFNPLTDTLINEEGQAVKLDPPAGDELPAKGFAVEDAGYVAPAADNVAVAVSVSPSSSRLQLLEPFQPITSAQLSGMRILIKAKGKCTTDHISMAGPWLEFRGHLQNIARNTFISAINYFNGEMNSVLNYVENKYLPVPESGLAYRNAGIGTVVFGEENYGEGSSREHAAMQPRYLGVKAVIVKSFARIHETNLKKQGMLALTFVHPEDYEKVRQDDAISILGFDAMVPGTNLTVVLAHSDGSEERFEVAHTYNDQQIEWVRAGSALNKIRQGMGMA